MKPQPACSQAIKDAISFYDVASGIPVLLSMLVLVYASARNAAEVPRPHHIAVCA